MITLQYKCILLSDIIINQKAATAGNQESLDFIPGSNFLGIVAGELYSKLSAEESLLIFHSGQVRFGDAHPMKNGMRTLRVPASMFYPKMKSASEKCYIHHYITDFNLLQKEQLKQCRSGFYAFSNSKGIEAEVLKTFAIKSAYDREKRRSKDEQMYGYQSIDKGSQFCFEIEIDDSASSYKELIDSVLTGKKRVGRSRTAQYGLVNIVACDFIKTESTTEEKIVSVYADARLIFLDETGAPTFQPTTKQLGLDGGKIMWEKSQIRTFQYAPWNFKRQARDTDRCGIEKGSVFVVDISKCADHIDLTSRYLGSYQNEGFGRVIYNPDFLKSIGQNGEAIYKLGVDANKEIVESTSLSGDTLLNYLALKKEEEILNKQVYEMVNRFVDNNAGRFQEALFASQWGTIRSIAMKNRTKDDLEKELFTKIVMRNQQPVVNGYLTHGVAKDKWSERGRLRVFQDFFMTLDDSNAQAILINLAAAMAKECGKPKNGGKNNE